MNFKNLLTPQGILKTIDMEDYTVKIKLEISEEYGYHPLKIGDEIDSALHQMVDFYLDTENNEYRIHYGSSPLRVINIIKANDEFIIYDTSSPKNIYIFLNRLEIKAIEKILKIYKENQKKLKE
jgi:hypothetical protein